MSDDVLEVLDRLVDVVERELPSGGPTPSARRHARDVARVLELAMRGLHDPEIGAELGMTVAAVRDVRRRRGVAGRTRHTGWQEQLRDLHAAGAGVAEMAEAMGVSAKTVYQRLSLLGLSLRAR